MPQKPVTLPSMVVDLPLQPIKKVIKQTNIIFHKKDVFMRTPFLFNLINCGQATLHLAQGVCCAWASVIGRQFGEAIEHCILLIREQTANNLFYFFEYNIRESTSISNEFPAVIGIFV